MASCSSCSVQKYTPEQRSKSCDTVCSSNSSCYFQRRKPVHPLASGFRTNYSRPTGNAVRQRVLSAKLLKLRTIQNQLNDANYHLAELARENQALKTLQKRQDKALSRYEGAKADLPRLLQSHEEEIRVLTERNRALKKTVKELNEQIKSKEEELTHAREQLKHLDKLNKDKHLGEREKLTEQLDEMKVSVKKYEDQVNMLNRKLMLENKNFKYKLNNEIAKHKQSQRELAHALAEIDKLTRLLDLNDRSTSLEQKRLSLPPKFQSKSLVSLPHKKSNSGSSSEKNSTDDLLIPKDLKLEPIQHKEENPKPNLTRSILKSPAENIKARLSGKARAHASDIENKTMTNSRSSSSNENKSLGESEVVNESSGDSIHSLSTISSSSRPSSSQKLDKISTTLEATIQRAIDNGTNQFELSLGTYCSEVVSTVRNCSDVIENHTKSLKNAREDTETIMEALRETDIIQGKLKHSHLLSVDPNNITDDNLDFVKQILTDEMTFQKQNKSKKLSKGKVDKNANQMQGGSKVKQEDKKKLLATLKAIDNGDSVESIDEMPRRKNDPTNEIPQRKNDLAKDIPRRRTELMAELFPDMDT